MRLLIENDLYYLARYILGYEDLDYMHWQLCQELRKEREEELYLLPREHLKSTIITIARTIQRILKDPNRTHLIVNAVLGNSKAFLFEIKQHLENNEQLQQIYPFITKKAKWDETSITLERDVIVKEPTVTVGGVGQAFASRHYDYVIFDDLLNENNTENITQIEKVIKWFQNMLPVIKKGGIRTVIGTRWDYNDLYSWIIKTIPSFFVYVRKIKEDGKYIYSSKFDEKRDELLKRNMKGFLYSCQYLNEPVSDRTQLFKNEYFEFMPIEDIEKIDCLQKYLVCDPASTRKQTSDYTAILCIGIDKDRKRYVIDLIRDKFTPQEQIDAIFGMVNKHNIHIAGIESFGFQGYLKFNLEQEMKRKDRYFTIIELTPKGRSKEDRISALEPLLRMKQITFVSECYYESLFNHSTLDMTQALIGELLHFPKAEHDDLSDCLAYFIDLDLWMGAKVKSDGMTLEKFKKLDIFSPHFEEIEDKLGVQWHGSNNANPYVIEETSNPSRGVVGY